MPAMKPETVAESAYRSIGLLFRLPWPLWRRLSFATAWLWRKLDARESRVARRNLQLVYPQLDAAARKRLHFEILRSAALQVFEVLRFWTQPPQKNLRCIVERHGVAPYRDALNAGKGAIVIAPHFGNWELLNQWLAAQGQASHKGFAFVYAPPESPVADAFLLRSRGNAGNVGQVRAEGPAVRQLWKALKDGSSVAILPDQQPKKGDGEFAPFFGIEALTMTLVCRLAERTGAPLFLCWCERIDDALAFALHIEPADPRIANADLRIATDALNAEVERVARRDPAQYQWTYKRFTIRPSGNGKDNPYAPPFT